MSILVNEPNVFWLAFMTFRILWWFFLIMLITVDHLVANAGVAPVCLFEDYDDITKASPAIVINHLAFNIQHELMKLIID